MNRFYIYIDEFCEYAHTSSRESLLTRSAFPVFDKFKCLFFFNRRSSLLSIKDTGLSKASFMKINDVEIIIIIIITISILLIF